LRTLSRRATREEARAGNPMTGYGKCAAPDPALKTGGTVSHSRDIGNTQFSTDFRSADTGAQAPLSVDLDGTLIHTDLLLENLVGAILKRPFLIFLLPLWLFRGRAHLKEQLARNVEFDPALLPYDERVLDYLRGEKAKGRRLILATGSTRSQAEAVAGYLGLFDAVLATEQNGNLKGSVKASILGQRLERFCYLGNDRSDMAVWRAAETVGLANTSRRLAQRIGGAHEVEIDIPRRRGFLSALGKALRPHQWAKNLLVFVPIVTANQIFDLAAWLAALGAFIAFSLTASGVYVLNDLTDLTADRRHLRKRNRPFASGMVPIRAGLMLSPLLLALGLGVSWCTGTLLALFLYVVVSLGYTVRAKEFPLVDVFCLAFLYVARLVGGGLATGFYLSQWLLGFSTFLFLSLALIKRVAELTAAVQDSKKVERRGYSPQDRLMLEIMGIGSAFASCVLLALFVQSRDVSLRYASPELLWLLVPLILFWQLRLWLSTDRGYMQDDPIVYAARDWVSWIASALGAAIMLLASRGSF
jgi:4-hydroxybenzoate polyprenyltransferase